LHFDFLIFAISLSGHTDMQSDMPPKLTGQAASHPQNKLGKLPLAFGYCQTSYYINKVSNIVNQKKFIFFFFAALCYFSEGGNLQKGLKKVIFFSKFPSTFSQ
jgi:hypothetical protein